MNGAPDWATDGRDWPNRDCSRFVDTGRIRWHVQAMGDGPDVVLIHGTGSATHSWRDLAPLLAECFRVTAFDLPGHGFTTGRPVGGLSLPAVSRAVADLLDALDIAPQAVVAHSAGAAIGLRMVLDGRAWPARFVGLGSALLPFPGLAAQLFPAFARLLFVNPFTPQIFARMARVPGEAERFLKRSTGSCIDRRGVEYYARLLGNAQHVGGALAMMAAWDLERLRDELPRLELPVLLIHGEQDTAIPIDRAHEGAALIPEAKLVRLAGLGHLAHEEAPEEVARLIRGFIEERR